MAALPVSVLNILKVASSQPQAAAKDTADGFSALLGIGQAPSGDEREPKRETQKNDESNVVAMVAPTTFYAADDLHALKQIRLEKPAAQPAKDAQADEPAPEKSLDNDGTRDVKRPARSTKPAKEKTADPAPRSASDVERSVSGPVKPAAQPAETQAVTNEENAPAAGVEDNAPVASAQEPLALQVQAVIGQAIPQLQQAQATNNPQAVAQAVQDFLQQLQQVLAATDLVTDEASQAVPETQQPLAETTGNVSIPNTRQVGDPSLLSPLNVDGAAAMPMEAKEKLARLNTLLEGQLAELGKILPALQSQQPHVAAAAKNTLLQQIESAQQQLAPLGGDIADASQPLQMAAVSTLGAAAQAPAAPNTPVKAQAIAQPLVAAQAVTAAEATINGGGEQKSGGGAKENLSQPQALSSTGSTAEAQAKNTNLAFSRVLQQHAHAPVAEQVMLHIKTAQHDGSSKINIKLNPEELGKVEIKLHVTADGKTGVVITADNKETLAMLQKDSAGLERALSDAGLKTGAGDLNFNLRGGQHEGNKEHAQASGNYLKAQVEEEEILPANVISRSYLVNLAEGLDIKI